MNSAAPYENWYDALWSDVRYEDSVEAKRPMLAHYTSIEVMEKILTQEEIWFSNPLCMNDMDEVRFGIQEAKYLVMNGYKIDAPINEFWWHEFQLQFWQCVSDFEQKHLLDTYLFCLSEHSPDDDDGILSMWRGYGRNGVGAALVIDTNKIQFLDTQIVVVDKVNYASREEQSSWIRSKISQCIQLAIASKIEAAKAAWYLFLRVKSYVLFTKNRGFKEEQEWRIVYDRTEDTELRLQHMLHYFIGPKGIEPKLKFKVAGLDQVAHQDLTLANIIHRIILGPGSGSPLAVSAAKRMLECIGKPELCRLVRGSGIPYRAI